MVVDNFRNERVIYFLSHRVYTSVYVLSVTEENIDMKRYLQTLWPYTQHFVYKTPRTSYLYSSLYRSTYKLCLLGTYIPYSSLPPGTIQSYRHCYSNSSRSWLLSVITQQSSVSNYRECMQRLKFIRRARAFSNATRRGAVCHCSYNNCQTLRHLNKQHLKTTHSLLTPKKVAGVKR